jgi:preprotein translocase subunit YajC
VIPYQLQFLLLAQANGQAPTGVPPFAMAIPIIAVLFYFMIYRPQKRQEQERRDTIQNLKENDRIVTIGGIHGVVTNVQRDAERVTIRVDEATGTKLKVGMSAIARVVSGDEAEGNNGAAKKA